MSFQNFNFFLTMIYVENFTENRRGKVCSFLKTHHLYPNYWRQKQNKKSKNFHCPLCHYHFINHSVHQRQSHQYHLRMFHDNLVLTSTLSICVMSIIFLRKGHNVAKKCSLISFNKGIKWSIAPFMKDNV